jgi:hypothetical protein
MSLTKDKLSNELDYYFLGEVAIVLACKALSPYDLPILRQDSPF